MITRKEKYFADDCFEECMNPAEFEIAFIDEFGYPNEELFENYREAY